MHDSVYNTQFLQQVKYPTPHGHRFDGVLQNKIQDVCPAVNKQWIFAT